MANIQNELNNIKTALYGKDVRNSIHDAIKTCYDDASVNNDNANMEVKLARGTHNTLNDRLCEVDEKQSSLSSQLAHKASKKNIELLKEVLSKRNEYSFGMKDIIYYEAEVKNPLQYDLSNTEIGLKINFDLGECRDSSNIRITRDGILIEHQFEGDVHPNYNITDDIATHSDGSLKSGILWIIDDVPSGKTNKYTIEVSTSQFTLGFSDKITTSIDTSVEFNPKDIFAVGINKFQFDSESGGHHLRRYYQNDVEVGAIDRLIFMPFIKVDSTDIEANSQNVNSTKKIEGDGVVYKDYIVSNTFKNYPIVFETKYRVFANGRLDIKTVLKSTGNTKLKRYGIKVRGLNSVGESYTALQGGMYREFDNGNSLFVKSYNCNLRKNNITNKEHNVINFCDTTQALVGMYFEESDAVDINKNSFYDVKLSISRVKHDAERTEETLMNRLFCHATKYTHDELKRRYLSLCDKFTSHMHKFGFWKSTFIGLYWYEKFCVEKLYGRDGNISTAIDGYINDMNTKYENMTTEGFKSQYTPEKGIEYIGRDTAPIIFFLKEAKLQGKTNSYNHLLQSIHNLADFYVWCENTSGESGRINLKLNSGEALNGSATALKALNYSLSIIEDMTRRDCYNRINTRLKESILFGNIIPNGRGESLVDKAQIHYSNFTLFEYIDAVNNSLDFDSSIYINQTVNASGMILESGYNFNPGRFGFVHTSTYAGYIMYKYNTISSLQTACVLMENVIKNCYPSYYHTFPIDRYNKVADTIDQPIEVQSCYQALMELVYS